jgi:peptidoglycan hydrolase CwlO-like protein
MSDINEKTKLPLGWAVTIMATVMSVAFTAGTAHLRLQNIEEQVKRYQEAQASHDHLDAEHELKLQRLDINLTNINDKLENISKKIDELGERRGR